MTRDNNEVRCAAIVACDLNNVIGHENKLPWSAPRDLRHFKNLSLDHVIVMGRLTFESIGKPLPRRHTIVVTRNKQWTHDGVHIVSSTEEARNLARKLTKSLQQNEYFVVGGAQIFSNFMPFIDRIHLTRVGLECAGDTWLHWPASDFFARAGVCHAADDHNPFLHFICLDRRKRLPLPPMPPYIHR